MKKPRDFFLEKHGKAEPDLDRLRRNFLSDAPWQDERAEAHRAFSWREAVGEFFTPRWLWAGMAGAWALILALEFVAGPSVQIARSNPPSAEKEASAALQDQLRWRAELLNSELDIEPRTTGPQSRAEAIWSEA